jgi:hypothetical protein
MQRRTIRLACETCDRSDKNGITARELKACEAEGWTGVTREQTYAQSCKTYDDPADQPPGFDILAWYTHLGTCPKCQQAAEATEPVILPIQN